MTKFEEAVFDLLGDNGYYYDGFHLTAEELSKQIVSLARKQIAEELEKESEEHVKAWSELNHCKQEGVYTGCFRQGFKTCLSVIKKKGE